MHFFLNCFYRPFKRKAIFLKATCTPHTLHQPWGFPWVAGKFSWHWNFQLETGICICWKHTSWPMVKTHAKAYYKLNRALWSAVYGRLLQGASWVPAKNTCSTRTMNGAWKGCNHRPSSLWLTEWLERIFWTETIFLLTRITSRLIILPFEVPKEPLQGMALDTKEHVLRTAQRNAPQSIDQLIKVEKQLVSAEGRKQTFDVIFTQITELMGKINPQGWREIMHCVFMCVRKSINKYAVSINLEPLLVLWSNIRKWQVRVFAFQRS